MVTLLIAAILIAFVLACLDPFDSEDDI